MQKLQLSIPEPCHENWQQMTPTDQGRFCNACEKEVVDFSVMTDKEVLNYFTHITHEKVCGRAFPDQLNRTITLPKEHSKKLFWYWNYIVMFFIFFGKGNSAKAQGAVKQVGTEQLTPKPALILDYALKGKVGGPYSNSVRSIKGTITTEAGEPIPFATVTIKGTNSGLSADVNGTFTIKISNNSSVLRVSAAGFKDMEEVVGNETELNIKLSKQDVTLGGDVVVTVGGMGFSNSDNYYGREDKLNRVAVITVKDEAFGKAIEKATVIISKNSVSKSDSTDKKGVYKIKGIKPYQQFNIEIKAAGYETNKLTITDADFKNRKQSWEVLLRKEELPINLKNKVTKGEVTNMISKSEKSTKEIDTSSIRTKTPALVGKETVVRMGSVNRIGAEAGALYVVDGVIINTSDSDINPDDVENVSVLQGPEAIALFGNKAANGAIVVTTKRQKVKNLDTVLISSFYTQGCPRTTSGETNMITPANDKESTFNRKLSDSLKILTTKISGALKVYPNPAQKRMPITVELKLKQIGLYKIQIIDAAGRIVLQKQIIATIKEFTEQIISDERWSSGMYYICLLDSKNQLINKRGFIFQ